jgi:hypothetical protein
MRQARILYRPGGERDDHCTGGGNQNKAAELGHTAMQHVDKLVGKEMKGARDHSHQAISGSSAGAEGAATLETGG